MLKFLLGNPDTYLDGKTPALRKLLLKTESPSPRRATGRLKRLWIWLTPVRSGPRP